MNSWICKVCFSSIVLAFSDVCYYIEISHGITYHINKSSQHWRGKNYCHALYSALDSVKMGDCVDCCSVAKALCCRHPQNSVLLSLSNSRYRVRRCFLGADPLLLHLPPSCLCVECIGMLHLFCLNWSLCLLSICCLLLLVSTSLGVNSLGNASILTVLTFYLIPPPFPSYRDSPHNFLSLRICLLVFPLCYF